MAKPKRAIGLGTIVLLVILAIVFGTGIFLYVKYPYVRGHLHIFSPRIQGTVTISENDTEKTYSFSGNDGHGLYDWTVGEDIVPVHIVLFNTNNWHVIKLNFRIERDGDHWLVSGTADCDYKNGHTPREYSFTVPYGESIEMHFEDDQLYLNSDS